MGSFPLLPRVQCLLNTPLFCVGVQNSAPSSCESVQEMPPLVRVQRGLCLLCVSNKKPCSCVRDKKKCPSPVLASKKCPLSGVGVQKSLFFCVRSRSALSLLCVQKFKEEGVVAPRLSNSRTQTRITRAGTSAMGATPAAQLSGEECPPSNREQSKRHAANRSGTLARVGETTQIAYQTSKKKAPHSPTQ